jgi:hypothetical protein
MKRTLGILALFLRYRMSALHGVLWLHETAVPCPLGKGTERSADPGRLPGGRKPLWVGRGSMPRRSTSEALREPGHPAKEG